MKKQFIFILCIFFTVTPVFTQNIPKINISSYQELPASFYKEGDANLPTSALSYDGRIVVSFQASFTNTGEGRAYDTVSRRTTVFWRNGEIQSGKYKWYAAEGYIRLSQNGSVAAFSGFIGGTNKTPADPWGAAVIVKRTDGRSPAKVFDLKQFLMSKDSNIDGARGISGMDMNADGSILLVTVPYHSKNDGEQARHYPIRVAIIEIQLNNNSVTLHSTASRGEQYYPFDGITTNASGKSFSYKGAGPGGRGTYAYIFTGQWVQRFGHYPVTNLQITGVGTQTNRSGPVIMGTADGPYVFIYPQERGPIIAYNWKSKSSLKFGTAQTGSDSIPSYADSRFASFDGDHLLYKSGSRWVWYDLQKQPGYLLPPNPKAQLTVIGFNNVIMSENGRTLLLHQIIGRTKRLVIIKI